MAVHTRNAVRVPSIAVLGVLVAVLGAGCAQIIGIEDLPDMPDGGNEPPDAGMIDPGPADAAPDANQPCTDQPLGLALSIDGVTAPAAPGEPYVEVLPGDLVAISAAGSCAREGDLALAWNITPDDGILATASPALADAPETFTAYAVTPGDYTVELTVSGSGAEPLVTSVLAIRVHGWQATTTPAGVGDVLDLSVGGSNLWIASLDGAYMLPLDGAPDAFTLVNDAINGDAIPNSLSAVFYDERTNFVWFGTDITESGAWRIEAATMESLMIAYDTTLDSARVFDIATAGTDTILMATSRGITEVSGGGVQFTGAIRPNGDIAVALATSAERRLAGAGRLYDLDTDAVYDFGLPGPDVLTMVIDDANDVLWASNDYAGVAEFDLTTNTGIWVHDTSDGLGSRQVPALALETQGAHAGDVWAATDRGVSRYISRRRTWIHMDENQGLVGHTDVRALAIDAGLGRRTIYAGSAAGVAYIRQP
jgi:hypothetical protein